MKQADSKQQGRIIVFKTVLFMVFIFGITLPIHAQVTIGSGIEPERGAALELKERITTSTDNSTSDRGMLFPRVKLTDRENLFPMFEPDGSGGYKIGTKPFNKTDEDRKHMGLTVYNINSPIALEDGLYIWNGLNWRVFESQTVIIPQIDELLCDNITIIPNVYAAGQPYTGILKIPYTGGNGGVYEATTPVSIGNGLSIELIAGTLAVGGGEVSYKITGTPTVSSPTLTSFGINFLGYTCNNISIGDGDVKSIYVKNLSADVTINAQYANNSPQTANMLPFEGGNVEITESGTYVFCLRLYGTVTKGGTTAIYNREPYYIYLARNNQSLVNVIDASEIDLSTPVDNTDYSYTIMLGGTFVAGDKVVIAMHRPTGGVTTRKWILRQNMCSGGNNISSCPVRTSMVYWKL